MIYEALSRLGGFIGNLNDRYNARGDRCHDFPPRWHAINTIAGWLYTLPDRRHA